MAFRCSLFHPLAFILYPFPVFRAFRVVAPLLLLLMCVVYAVRTIGGGEDFWAHAALGRWALENHAVPRHTLFLWSADIPWIFHSWGSGVLFALILGSVGVWGAVALNVIMSAAPFAVLYNWWRNHQTISSLGVILFAVAIFLASARFRLRTEMFTMFFLSLVATFILTEHKKRWHYVAVAAVFALWPNLHGAVLMGLVILWSGTLAELAQFRRAALPLLPLALVCTLCVFTFNPWHFGYAQTWSGLDTPLFRAVNEWKPFWEKPHLPAVLWGGHIAFWCVALLLWIANPKRRWACLIWLLIVGAAFLQARRQMWLASIFVLLTILANSDLLTGPVLWRGWRAWTTGQRDANPAAMLRNIGKAGAIVLVACFIAQGFIQYWPPKIINESYPAKMSEYLRTQAPPGRIFNDYEYSAALEWLLQDKRKLYVDLINAYPPQLLFEYLQIAGGTKTGLKMLDKRKFDIVALRPRKPDEGMANLAKFLNNSPAWAQVYDGADGTVWLRVKRFNAPLTPIPASDIAPIPKNK